MGLTIEALTQANAAEWDDLVRASPDGWSFSLAGWQRLILAVQEWGLQDHSFAVREGAKLVAVMPLQHRPANKTMGSSGWGGSGPVIAAERTGAARDHLFTFAIDEARRRASVAGAEKLEMSCSPVTRASIETPWGVSPFALRGMQDASRLSQVIDLSVGAEALWDGLSKSARQAVRTAEKAGFTCRRLEWAEWLNQYYDVHCETYQRDGLTPHPKAYFRGIAEEIAPGGAAVLWGAFDFGGAAVAFHNEARMGAGAYYHTGCSRDAARGDGVAYLLLWRAIESASKDGMRWYDIGWVFPEAQDEKQRGLTLFKTRFGGEPHRAFNAEAKIEKLDPLAEAPPATEAARPANATRQAYEGGAVYKTETICTKIDRNAPAYADRLLYEKIALIRKHMRTGVLLDLCCATGGHLFELAEKNTPAIGIDFSVPFLAQAQNTANTRNLESVAFVGGDAMNLPIRDSSVATLYSLSSLYQVPGLGQVMREVQRVLAPGGRCILDLGNSRSLNAISVKQYKELPQAYHMPPSQMRALAVASGMRVVEHRAFQILPLWADKPKWMGLLLHPRWKTIMAKRIGGKMVDEWLSNLPFLKPFAFRHLLVCEKIG